MSDFEEINEAFINKFEDCELENQTTAIRAIFKNETDAKWFQENICYPKSLDLNEYPVRFISAMSPIGDLKFTSKESHTVDFQVKDKNKLINLLNNK